MKRSTFRIAACLAAIALGLALYAQAQVTSKTGIQFGSDGSTPFLRSSRAAALIVQQNTGKYAEAVLRGNVYFATTGAGGQAVQTSIGTTTNFTLWNPLGSGKTFRVMRVTGGYVSGTLGSGVVGYGINNTSSSTAPTGGSASTPRNALIGAANSSVATCGFGQTVVANPILAEMLGSTFAELATSTNGIQQLIDDVDGRYMIQPGNGFSIVSNLPAGGTSPVMNWSVMWEEITQGNE